MADVNHITIDGRLTRDPERKGDAWGVFAIAHNTRIKKDGEWQDGVTGFVDCKAFKGVFDADPDGMLLYPDPDMPYAVAVTAWTNEVVCSHYSPGVLDVIQNFRDTYRGNGPEQGIPINLP